MNLNLIGNYHMMLRGAFSQPLTFPWPLPPEEVPAVAMLPFEVEAEAVTSLLLSRSMEVSEDTLELSEEEEETRRILGMHSCEKVMKRKRRFQRNV